ncbi:MAG TPA: hypothetical protein VMM78_04040 [Thermomicrobiales bacterium]|nr:hypothetical protein [Thermomicrobiales bacterium]
MSAASNAGSTRPFHALPAGGATRSLWISRASELLGDWAMLVALLALVYRLSGSVPIVGLFVLARVLARAVVEYWSFSRPLSFGPRALALLCAGRVPLFAALALVSTRDDLWWAAPLVLAAGALGSLSDAGRATLLPRLMPRGQVIATNTANVSVERLCFLFGPLLGALALSQWNHQAAFIVAAGLLALAAALLLLLPGSAPADGAAPPPARLPAFRERPLLITTAAALFTSAVVAVSLLVALIALATGPLDRSEAGLGALLACVGIGMFVGPLPAPKLLNRLPVPFLLAGSGASLAAGMAAVSQIEWLPGVAAILFLIGLCAITNDTTASIAVRRSTRDIDLPGAIRAMRLATIAGQITGAAAVTMLCMVWSVTSVLLVIGVFGAVAASALFIALYGRYYVNRFAERGRASA